MRYDALREVSQDPGRVDFILVNPQRLYINSQCKPNQLGIEDGGDGVIGASPGVKDSLDPVKLKLAKGACYAEEVCSRALCIQNLALREIEG